MVEQCFSQEDVQSFGIYKVIYIEKLIYRDIAIL